MELYEKKVIPTLRKFGVCNDEVIASIMMADTMEAIYHEAIKRNEKTLKILEEMANSREEDFWAPLREHGTEVKNPWDEGFIFREMPLANEPMWMKEKVIKSITVKGCKLSFSQSILEEEAVYIPTDNQRELYDIIVEFCDKLKAMGVKCNRSDILTSKYGEYLEPNTPTLLYKGIGK